mgnify:CR=1 FL=1
MSDAGPLRDRLDLRFRNRALIVCDVDEVALEFVNPFNAFLNAIGFELLPRSFRLTGNVVALEDGSAAEREKVQELLDGFFASQMDWQTPTDGVETALANLSDIADIVFLTAMPPRHFEVRRSLLDRHNLPYPLVATMDAKGPLIEELHDGRDHPVIFIDDLVHNLHSAQKHVPHAFAINYMSNDRFRAMAPHPGMDVAQAEDWVEIERIIRHHIGA